jgi:hypothetical protein
MDDTKGDQKRGQEEGKEGRRGGHTLNIKSNNGAVENMTKVKILPLRTFL